MRSETKRRRFVATRAAVRTRLARELGIAAEQVALRVGEHGKPELVAGRVVHGPGGTHRARAMKGLLRLSISHSEELGAIAIRRAGEVGVDVEHVRAERGRGGRHIDWKLLLERICGESERDEATWEAEAVGARIAFHERWVAKEAVVKAFGCGLRIAPSRVMVSREGKGLQFTGLRGWGVAATRCALLPLEVPRGFVGAMALVDGPSVDPDSLLAGCDPGCAEATIR